MGALFFKKVDRIISKSNTKYWRNTNKYSVRISKTAAEYLELDRYTGQPLWGGSLYKRWTRQKYHMRKFKVVRLKKLGKVILIFNISHVTLYLM